MASGSSDPARVVVFMGSSRADLAAFPDEARKEVGYALWIAQVGRKHARAKPLKGDGTFKGATILEIVEDHDTDTFRAVYTVKFREALYVLHAFKKKSKSGSETPKKEIALIRRRYAQAEAHYEKHFSLGSEE